MQISRESDDYWWLVIRTRGGVISAVQACSNENCAWLPSNESALYRYAQLCVSPHCIATHTPLIWTDQTAALTNMLLAAGSRVSMVMIAHPLYLPRGMAREPRIRAASCLCEAMLSHRSSVAILLYS